MHINLGDTSFGWSDNQLALYPTQKTYEALADIWDMNMIVKTRY